MAKKIIVIGSGFGGLAASLRLKAKGYDVTLLEKHSDLGGRARVFKKGNTRRKRIECVEVKTGKLYLFNPNAEVEILD